LDERSNSTAHGGWKQNWFTVGNSRIFFAGQVNTFVQFYSEIDAMGPSPFTAGGQMVILREGGVKLAFSDEIQVLGGLIRKPFTRAQLTDGYALIIPYGYWVDPQGLLIQVRQSLVSTEGGVVVQGRSDLAEGLFRYRVGVFNEDRSNFTKFWDGMGWRSVAFIDRLNDKKGFEWNVRVEFTPAMLGFKPEPAGGIGSKLADTYFGGRDVLTIGFGYHAETHTPRARIGMQVMDELKRRGWTVDAMFEKRFKDFVPNFQAGYIRLDDTHYYRDFESGGVMKGGSKVWYLTGQVFYDRVIGLGKPAVAFRYERMVADGQVIDGSVVKKDLTAETLGLALNYYIKGQAARLSFGTVQTKYKDAAGHSLSLRGGRDKITDYYLYFQVQF
jgi:hypothetical protein